MVKKFVKDIYVTAGFKTVALGSGRKEFHPKKPRPGIDHYIKEAGKGSVSEINSAENIDETVVANFMAERFVNQGNLEAFMPLVDESFKYKPSIRVEGACGTGGLGLVTSMKNVLSGLADTSLTVGVEVQNTVKAIYGADILAGAGWYEGFRKEGHAFFFPDTFSQKAGVYYEKFGKEETRKGMAAWYENAILNARKCPEAQEYHNRDKNPKATGMTPPHPSFVENINVFDCSKVSDGAASMIFASEEGLSKLGKTKKDAVQLVGYGHCVANITEKPEDYTKLETSRRAALMAYEMAGLTADDIGVLEVHDCFTITGMLMLEAAGFAEYGKSSEFVQNGEISGTGRIPTNTSGGLVGYGHPTGASGVRMAVDLYKQLTGTAGDYQVEINPDRPYGMMISMGGDDKTVVVMIFKKTD